jgi:hypothetical protein
VLRTAAFYIAVAVMWVAAFWLFSVRRGSRREEDPQPERTPPPVRENPADLPLAERDARDRRIAAAVARRWKKRGIL